ncbi:MAG: hypothetical protein QGI24_05410 [Kiritimatiellia bacterium]|nr:hypothetical protein [Kiritimatiellia bacterium]MDP6848207.1 hypothetical protein [Kiritimatiellia bacterium]
MRKTIAALCCIAALTAHAWELGEPVPEKTAPIKAPFGIQP